MILKDKVTILIAAYNREKYIIECIQSVFDQSYSDFEIIVYDDASTDTTKDKVLAFRKGLEIRYKHQLKIISGEIHKGVGYARDFLLKQVKTPYACWLDSDDLMHPTRLVKQLTKIKKGNYDIVFSYTERFTINSGGEKQTKDIVKINVEKYSDFHSLKFNTTSPSGFFKRELQEYHFNHELTLGGEDVLWLFTLLTAGKKVGLVPEPVYYYRMHKDRIGVIKRRPEFVERKHFEGKIMHEEVKKLTSQVNIKRKKDTEVQ